VSGPGHEAEDGTTAAPTGMEPWWSTALRSVVLAAALLAALGALVVLAVVAVASVISLF
jgi:hypothetical protein